MTLSHSKLFNKLDKDSLLWPLYHEMDVPWIMLKVKSWSPTVRVMAIRVWQAWQSAFLTFVSMSCMEWLTLCRAKLEFWIILTDAEIISHKLMKSQMSMAPVANLKRTPSRLHEWEDEGLKKQ